MLILSQSSVILLSHSIHVTVCFFQQLLVIVVNPAVVPSSSSSSCSCAIAESCLLACRLTMYAHYSIKNGFLHQGVGLSRKLTMEQSIFQGWGSQGPLSLLSLDSGYNSLCHYKRSRDNNPAWVNTMIHNSLLIKHGRIGGTLNTYMLLSGISFNNQSIIIATRRCSDAINKSHRFSHSDALLQQKKETQNVIVLGMRWHIVQCFGINFRVVVYQTHYSECFQ